MALVALNIPWCAMHIQLHYSQIVSPINTSCHLNCSGGLHQGASRKDSEFTQYTDMEEASYFIASNLQ